MSDKMRPQPLRKLITMALDEYRVSQSIFGIPRESFCRMAGDYSAFPFGPAAGPHTQLSQNILCGYLTGARFFELKTIQVLDRLDLEKPCIYAGSECYNVEWSTELTLDEAFDEYLKAWLLLHFFGQILGLHGSFKFNMSVGYDLEGISSAGVDAFIENMKNAGAHPLYKEYKAILEDVLSDSALFTGTDLTHSSSKDLIPRLSPHISAQASISTMHGCPPEEIEKICRYMLDSKELDTFVKLNPTLLGKEFINRFLKSNGYDHIDVPNEAFEKDLKMDDALAMLKRLTLYAHGKGRSFGIKLTNTLGVRNNGDQLPGNEMYLSGRPLYPLAINVAARLAEALGGEIPLSFSGGINGENVKEVMETGIRPVTVCTELLKPGGYLRMPQMVQEVLEAEKPLKIDVNKLKDLAEKSLKTPKLKNPGVHLPGRLPLLDCAVAPCQAACPIGQDVPRYIRLIGESKYAEALRVIYERNPLPSITGHYCSRLCESNCTRMDFEGSVNIRELKKKAHEYGIKQFLREYKPATVISEKKAALLGYGIFSLSAAFFLARQGFEAVIFKKDREIDEYTLPGYKFPLEKIKSDVDFIKARGVRIQDLSSFDAKQYTLVIDGENHRKKTIIEEIAEARRVTGENDREKPLHSGAAGNRLLSLIKGRMMKAHPFDAQIDARRCLECDEECNKCIDVCPNRANVSIRVEGFTQIIHMDALCNECGNCGTFCPWEGDPYRDKVTVFSGEEDFKNSRNPGFLLKGRDLNYRFNGEVSRTSVDNPDLPEKIINVFKTIKEQYDYLLGVVE
jgi:putative selenate reductase